MGPPIVAAVREFVERDVRPHASALEHEDTYPHAMVAAMRELGLFGALVPAAYGGLGVDVTTYARIIEELCRGWMSLAGVINSHTMAALIVLHHGTDEQRARLLPRFAAGDARGGLCLTEPHAGSDVQAIRTTARRRGDDYVLDGSKMFVTNGREGNTFALLALTDPKAEPRHRGMSCFIVEKGHAGLRVVKSIAKLGYKGVDTAELLFEDFPVPAANLVGGVEGRGFKHVMSGLEAGRINIAARAVGVAQAAWEATLGHVRGGTRPADPRLADMAGRLHSARLLTYWSAGMKDRGERCDLEAGMAKLYASETAQTVAEDALRVLGEDATLTVHPVERYYRDTPLMIIGEGTNEIQRTIIARNLVDRYGERAGALTSLDGEPEERRQMVMAVRQIVEKDIAPAAHDAEHAGRSARPLVSRLAELGLLAASIPADAGGLGLPRAACAMLLEELARGWASLATIVGGHLVAIRALAGRRAPSLGELGRGERLAAIALSGDIRLRRDGATAMLDGRTALVAGASSADVLVTAATAEDGRRVLVEVPVTTPGVHVGATEPVLGLKAAESARVVFDRVRLTNAVLADGALDDALGFAHLVVAAIAVGLSQGAFEAALRYAQQRSAFGKPISQHQAIQLKLADMATAISAARLLVADAGDDPIRASIAKLQAVSTALTATLESMRTHGGYGYTAEFPVERYYRDAARLPSMPVPEDETRAAAAAALRASDVLSLDGPWPSNVL
jgi:alkylation response protein AidB-like acyl-CoA dehydrogenase